jgi:hypothetical protein
VAGNPQAQDFWSRWSYEADESAEFVRLRNRVVDTLSDYVWKHLWNDTGFLKRLALVRGEPF